MKACLLLISFCSLFSTFHADESSANKNELRLNSEPPKEIKAIFEKYGVREYDKKILPADMQAGEVQALNDYLKNITGKDCITEYWQGSHACEGPCPANAATEARRYGFLWHTTCGTTCVVYCRYFTAEEGC